MALKLLLGAWMAAVIAAAYLWAPAAAGMGEISRIIYFHIPAAWVSVLAFFACMWFSIKYLRQRKFEDDLKAAVAGQLGLIFCLVATVSGAIFAKATWGSYWNWDPRETSIFVLVLIYAAYFALRSAIEDFDRRGSLSAVYSIVAFITVPFLVFVVPRIPALQSLHPSDSIISSSGKLNMDPKMLTVLLASLAGFTGIFFWMFRLGSAVEILAAKSKRALSRAGVRGKRRA